MFCTNCGVKVNEEVKFCSNCGNPLVQAGSEIKVENLTQEQSSVLSAPTTLQSQNSQMAQSITADEKYCFSCGSVIKKAAEICVKCGVNQNKRSSTTAIDVYCTSCGKTIKKDAATCPFCGVAQEGSSSKNKTTAIVLLIFTAVGHRFYTGKIGTAIIMGLIYFFGLIFCGLAEVEQDEVFAIPGFILLLAWLVWWIIDLVGIGTGKFLDKQGNPLKKN